MSLQGHVLGIEFLYCHAQASDLSWRFLAGTLNNWNKVSWRFSKPLFGWKSEKDVLEILTRISPSQCHLHKGQVEQAEELKASFSLISPAILQPLFLPIWVLMQGNRAEDSLPALCSTCTTAVGTCCFFLEAVMSLDFPILPWTPFSCAKEQLWTPSQTSVTPNGTRNRR